MGICSHTTFSCFEGCWLWVCGLTELCTGVHGHYPLLLLWSGSHLTCELLRGEMASCGSFWRSGQFTSRESSGAESSMEFLLPPRTAPIPSFCFLSSLWAFMFPLGDFQGALQIRHCECYTQTWRPCRRCQTSWQVDSGRCHHCLITGWWHRECAMRLEAPGSDIKSDSVRDQMVWACFCFLISLSIYAFSWFRLLSPRYVSSCPSYRTALHRCAMYLRPKTPSECWLNWWQPG